MYTPSPCGLKAAGVLIGTIFLISLGLNIYFAAHTKELTTDQHYKFFGKNLNYHQRLSRQLGPHHEKFKTRHFGSKHERFSTEDSSQLGGSDWQDVAKGSLATCGGDSSVILDALNDYDATLGLSRNWFVSVCLDDDDLDYKAENGKVYYKKAYGYKMVVYEEKYPPSQTSDDTDVAKCIIDAAVDRNPFDAGDIKDAIEDALDALDIDFSFLNTWTSNTTSVSQSLNVTYCIVENEQAFLYLENCSGSDPGPGPGHY